MSNKILKMIKALEESVTKIGVDKTIDNLNVSEYSINTTDYIINLVCEEFKLPTHKIKNATKTSSQKRATHIISYLLYYQATLTQSEIGSLLGRSKASVNRYISDIHYLSETVKHERDLKEKIVYFEKKIKEHKNNKY